MFINTSQPVYCCPAWLLKVGRCDCLVSCIKNVNDLTMTKQKTTPMNAKGESFEKVFPAKDLKKSISVRKQSGRVGKVVLKSDHKKLDT